MVLGDVVGKSIALTMNFDKPVGLGMFNDAVRRAHFNIYIDDFRFWSNETFVMRYYKPIGVSNRKKLMTLPVDRLSFCWCMISCPPVYHTRNGVNEPYIINIESSILKVLSKDDADVIYRYALAMKLLETKLSGDFTIDFFDGSTIKPIRVNELGRLLDDFFVDNGVK